MTRIRTDASVRLREPFHAESLVNAIHHLSAERPSYAEARPSDETAPEPRREDI